MTHVQTEGMEVSQDVYLEMLMYLFMKYLTYGFYIWYILMCLYVFHCLSSST